MSNPKERHYWAQLRSALTAGQWRSSHPARAPNGALLSWSELFRKFNKHCKGFQDVAEVAAQTRSLALLVGARYVDDDEDADMDGIPDNEVDNEAMVGEKEEGWRRGTLALGDECVLPEERVEEATSGYEVLNSPESSKFDVGFVVFLSKIFSYQIISDYPSRTCLLRIRVAQSRRVPLPFAKSASSSPIRRPHSRQCSHFC